MPKLRGVDVKAPPTLAESRGTDAAQKRMKLCASLRGQRAKISGLVIETFVAGQCRHRKKHLDPDLCTRSGDVSHTYYEQSWVTTERCPSCHGTGFQTLYAYTHPSGAHAIVCPSCTTVMWAYEPIYPPRGTTTDSTEGE